ncbi:hypothetical protein ACFWXK_20895 [Streptomyces sp. NPDC059070]|uniref:hypothetical protein n=1 Tax=unclassified Streptomyces TaxID=2593676 RepID=UPI0034E27903
MSAASFTVRVEVLVAQRDPSNEEVTVLQIEDDGAWRLPGTIVSSWTDVPNAARLALAAETGLDLRLARILALDEATEPGHLVIIMDGGFVGPDRATLIGVMSGKVASLPNSRWASFDDLKDSPRRIGYAVAASYNDLPLPLLVDGMSDVERWHTPTPSDPTAP